MILSNNPQYLKLFQFSAAIFIPQVFALITLVVLTTKLSLSDYASIAVLEALLLLITPLMSLGIDRAAAKYSTTLDIKLVHEVGNGIISTSCIALFIPYLCIYFLFNLGANFKLDLSDFLAVYLIAYSYNLLSLLQVKNQFSGEPMNYLIASVMKTFFPMIFISIGILLLDLGNKSFIYGLLITSIILIFYTRSNARFALLFWKKNWGLGRSMIVYGLPLLPAFISGWAISWSNRFFLSLYVTEQELGLYSAVFKYSLIFFLFIQAANLYITPIIYKLLEEKNYKKVEKYLLASIFLFLFGAIIYTGVLKFVLPYLGVFSSIEIIFGVGIMNYLSGIAALTTQLLLLFHNKTKELMYGAIFYAVICMASYSILIPKLQIFGVLFSNVICVAIANMVFLMLSKSTVTFRRYSLLYILLNSLVILVSIIMLNTYLSY
jgi:O-antigen/teichoic acid export membrane protein